MTGHIHRVIAFVGVVWSLGLAFTLVQIWFAAYIAGAATVTVDAFDEQWIEYVLWYVAWPAIVLGTYYAIEMITDE